MGSTERTSNNIITITITFTIATITSTTFAIDKINATKTTTSVIDKIRNDTRAGVSELTSVSTIKQVE